MSSVSENYIAPSYNNSRTFPPVPNSPPHASSSAFIEEILPAVPVTSVVNVPVTTVAATLPSATQSFALGNGSDTSDESLSDVSIPLCPVSVPHLIWRANFFGTDEFPVPVDCLLDSGAHLVLIRPEVIMDLGLPVQKLKKPFPVSLALNGKETATTLDNCVTLSISALNNAWSSHSVTAIIAPHLCTNILLGLPFLAHNKIVIDHNAHTVIHKPSGFDLLNKDAVCLKIYIQKSC